MTIHLSTNKIVGNAIFATGVIGNIAALYGTKAARASMTFTGQMAMEWLIAVAAAGIEYAGLTIASMEDGDDSIEIEI